MIGGSIVAANISSHQLVGSMGVAYSRGFVAMVTEWGMILVGLNALLWIFLPFYLRNGFYTVPEFLNRRFGPGVRTTYAVLILLTYMLVEIGAVLYMGSLALNSLLGIPLSYSIIVLAIVTGFYTIMGGLRRWFGPRCFNSASCFWAESPFRLRRFITSAGFMLHWTHRVQPAESGICFCPPMIPISPGRCTSAGRSASAPSTQRPISSSCNARSRRRMSGTREWESSSRIT